MYMCKLVNYFTKNKYIRHKKRISHISVKTTGYLQQLEDETNISESSASSDFSKYDDTNLYEHKNKQSLQVQQHI